MAKKTKSLIAPVILIAGTLTVMFAIVRSTTFLDFFNPEVKIEIENIALAFFLCFLFCFLVYNSFKIFLYYRLCHKAMRNKAYKKIVRNLLYTLGLLTIWIVALAFFVSAVNFFCDVLFENYTTNPAKILTLAFTLLFAIGFLFSSLRNRINPTISNYVKKTG